ncbi:MAG TPA: hypothetical protein VJP80_03580 [Candidatus Saccharimonadales bacterium]|nr:hypothetical protein [Candidatus Saccharimonadales bacterium]
MLYTQEYSSDIQPGTIDMAAFEQMMSMPTTEYSAFQGEQPMIIEVPQAVEEITFDPVLVSMFMRAKPGSEFASSLSKAIATDFVIKSTIASPEILAELEQRMWFDDLRDQKDRQARLDNEDDEQTF